MAAQPSKQAVKTTRKLSILQWNSRSLRRNLPFLKHHITQNNYDILCIQSPNCFSPNLPKLEGYYYPPVRSSFRDRPKFLGAVTYIKTGIPYTINKTDLVGQSPTAAGCAIEVTCSGQTIKVANIYQPKPDPQGLWVPLITGSNWVVTGDFNVHHPFWERGADGARCAEVANRIVESDLVLLNNGSPTRVPDLPTQSMTAPDLSLVSSNLAIAADWSVGSEPLSSDHFPISISLQLGVTLQPTDNKESFLYHRADWARYRGLLEEVDSGDWSSLTIQEHYERLQSTVLEAARTSIPRATYKGDRPRNNPWWTAECEKAVRLKRQACRRYKQHSTAEAHACMLARKREANAAVAKAKLQYWEKYTQTLDDNTRLSSIFREIKKMKQQYNLPDPPLSTRGQVLTTNQAKAEAFAQTFAEVGTTAHLSEEAKLHRRLEEEHTPLNDPPLESDQPINSPITLPELSRVLTSFKSKKSAVGEDLLSYRMLGELPTSFVEKLLVFFRRVWGTGVIPSNWRHAIVVPIPKKGKPRGEASSYRPISLTSQLGKVFERIIKSRLEFFCEQRGIIPRCQAGFRRGRGVTDHIVKLGAHVRRALTKRRHLYSCFFDLRRAFDTVWHHRLLCKLQKLGIEGQMYHYIKAFLSNRTFQVRTGGALSGTQSLDMGVPQGSVLGPLLFSIMLHDVESVRGRGVTMTLYADDLAIWREGFHTNFIRDRKRNGYIRALASFQEDVDRVVEYLLDNGFSLSAAKTQFVIFTRAKVYPTQLFINVDNVPISLSPQAEYLGCLFSRKGSCLLHVTKNVTKASKAINLIKMLSYSPWAKPSKVMVGLVVSLVRSRLTYGMEAFYDLPPSHLKRLEVAECQALKRALGVPRGTPNVLVYRDAGLLPLKNHIQLMCAKYAHRAGVVPNSTKKELGEHFMGPPKGFYPYSGMVSFRQHIRALEEGAGVYGLGAAKRPPPVRPPWLLEEADVGTNMGGLRKCDDPNLLCSTAREFIATRLPGRLTIYTDGSLGDHSAGAAFCIPAWGVERRYKLPKISIFSVELFAILMALEHLAGMDRLPNAVAILSDSMSALQAVMGSGRSTREDMVTEIKNLTSQLIRRGCHVLMQWVPAHVGIGGNEHADRAAKQAAAGDRAQQVDMTLALSDIKAKLVQEAWAQWGREFSVRAGELGALDPSAPSRAGVFFPQVPAHLEFLIHRIRAGVWRCIYVPKRCVCGDLLSPHHLIFRCTSHIDHFKPLLEKIDSLKLEHRLYSLVCSHPDAGWDLLIQTAWLLYTCQVAPFV